MAHLTTYVLRNLYGEAPGEASALRLLALVVARTARLAAQLMAAGFVHGVLNSDNINVTGESFDYGPWRFNPTWDPGFTAAYFDHAGLYAFGRQPEAIHWDAMQLTSSLRLIAEEEALVEAFGAFPDAYRAELAQAFLWRLGVTGSEAQGIALVQALAEALTDTQMPIDRCFFDCFGGAVPAEYPSEFDGVRGVLAGLAPRKGCEHSYWSDAEPCSMLIDEVEAIWSAIDMGDDWRPFHDKIAAIRRMGEALG